jgi:hypothetical protein
MKNRGRILIGTLLVGGAIALASASAASARTLKTIYPSVSASKVTSAFDWAGSTNYSGLCLQVLTCPTVTNTRQTSGGVGGGANNGLLNTHVGPSLAGVGATSSGTWESTAFKYVGAAGHQPNKVTFRLFRRSNTQALLNVAGSDAFFQAVIANASNSRVVATLFQHVTLTSTGGSWAKVGPVDLQRNQLRRGRRYRILIGSTFVEGAQVVPAADADYDNIQLVAKRHLHKGSVR